MNMVAARFSCSFALRAVAVAAAADVAPPPPVPVAKSIKCVATGELFPTMAAAQAYAAQTGRTDFEESTEECVPEPPPEDPEDDELYK